MTRRFEFRDAKSNKFWEITVEGKAVTVRYGRLGTDGQTQVKAYAAPAAAKAAAEKQVEEKIKKGYREVGEGDSSAAIPQEVDLQRLTAIESLFAQDDADAIAQGVALVNSLADPSLWSKLAEGISIGAGGKVKAMAPKKGARGGVRYSQLAVLWILSMSGRLRAVRKLDVSGCKGLRDVTPLQGLSKLKVLNLAHCKDLVSLDGLISCVTLKELSLSGCTKLATLEGLRGCSQLEAIELYGENKDSKSSEFELVVNLEERELLPLNDAGWLPIKADAYGRDGYWGESERMASVFAALRDYLNLPNLEVVYLREPNEEERDSAKRDGWLWNADNRRWDEVEDGENDYNDEDDEDDEDDVC